MKGAAQIFGYAIGAVDLRDPFRHLPVHAAVVDFLERLAFDEIVADLSDEENERCRVLLRGMDADGCVRCAGPACHETDAGPPGELAVGLRHVRGAPFLPADDEADLLARVMERVEHGEIAFSGDSERDVHSMDFECVHQ